MATRHRDKSPFSSIQTKQAKPSSFAQPVITGQPTLPPALLEIPNYTPRSAQWVMENNLLSGLYDPQPIQAKLASGTVEHKDDVIQPQEKNNTGLPDKLKAGIENLSEMAMDDVRVHYNSSKPAQLTALAYTQGTDIHIAPGQEANLPHETWHVVQQKQGRVKPTIQAKGVSINQDERLEKEADVMGAKALNIEQSMISLKTTATKDNPGLECTKMMQRSSDNLGLNIIQLAKYKNRSTGDYYETNDPQQKWGVNWQTEWEIVSEDETQEQNLVIIETSLVNNPEKHAETLSDFIMNYSDLAAKFFKMLTPKDLWQFAQTSRIGRQLAQTFCLNFLPAYQDKYSFNLATKGLLLVTPPSEKYGGAKEAGSPHATSGYKWYQAALTGKGPIVLGGLDDYMPMRDYTKYVSEKAEAEKVENTAQYLMAWPWSLLVNAALVTGAIHGKRPVIGATDPTKENVLWKKPDNKDTFGLTVYARELIQLILLNQYKPSTAEELENYAQGDVEASAYPKPATEGGLLLLPPTTRPKIATIFDVGKESEDKYGKESDVTTLLTDLKLPEKGKETAAYTPIVYNLSQQNLIKSQKTSNKKLYDKVKKKIKEKVEKNELKETDEMVKAIYPNGINKPSLPSIPTWQLEEYKKQLGLSI